MNHSFGDYLRAFWQGVKLGAKPGIVLGYVTFVLVLIARVACGADNFTTSTQGSLSQQVVNRAEQCRKDIAQAFLGESLPDLMVPCQIQFSVSSARAGSGETTFIAFGPQLEARMIIHGSSVGDLMDNVIPHECAHLVFRQRFGQPLPRWLDEGMASTCESDRMLAKHDVSIRGYAQQNRLYPLNRIFMAREYLPDVLPMYAQSTSVARWLNAHPGGFKRVIGLWKAQKETDSWTQAFQHAYGYRSLREVQDEWQKWFVSGSGDIVPPEYVVAKMAENTFDEIPRTILRQFPRQQLPYRPSGSWDQSMSAGQPTTPQAGQPQCQSSSRTCNINVDIDKLADTIVAKYGDQLKGDPGEPGAAGEPGRDGTNGQNAANVDPQAIAAIIIRDYGDQLKGNDGRDGKDAANVDPAELAKTIQPYLDPIYASWIDADGNPIDRLTVPLGGQMPLRITREIIDAGTN